MSVKHKLAVWIDTDVIAEHILGELEDQGIPATFENAKSITMKNGRPATQGVCPTCGTKMFRIGKS